MFNTHKGGGSWMEYFSLKLCLIFENVLGLISQDINCIVMSPTKRRFILLYNTVASTNVHKLGGRRLNFYYKIPYSLQNEVSLFSKDFQTNLKFRVLVFKLLNFIIENVQFILFCRIKRKNKIII